MRHKQLNLFPAAGKPVAPADSSFHDGITRKGRQTKRKQHKHDAKEGEAAVRFSEETLPGGSTPD